MEITGGEYEKDGKNSNDICRRSERWRNIGDRHHHRRLFYGQPPVIKWHVADMILSQFMLCREQSWKLLWKKPRF